MNVSLLLTMYGSSAAIAVGVFVATLRVPGRSLFRVGLLIYLTGTTWWALVDVWRWVVGAQSIQAVEAWTMPAGALVIAGVRVGVFAATRVAWRPGPFDIVGLALHPVGAIAVACVPAWRDSVASETAGGVVTYGPLFWAHVAVTYALLAAGTLDLLRPRRAVKALTRRAVPVVVSIWAVPLVASVVTVTSEGPNGIDLMPPGFALTALLIWRTLVPAEVGHAVTVARSQVFEDLTDAVIVVGDKDQILDANAAALALVGADAPVSAVVGQSLRTTWPLIADATVRGGEHDLLRDAASRVVDVQVSPLSESSGAPRGRVLVIRDVTEAVRQRRELASLRAELADMVIRDVSTGLHNRRYAEQVLPDHLARCAAKSLPLSVAIIDADHFKSINDRYGHAGGDRVLEDLAAIMVREMPDSMVARIGGEEFLVILPGLSGDEALVRTERLRAACARAEVASREGVIRVTVSAGVASTLPGEVDAEQLLARADAALYRAKREGRNRTCMADDAYIARV